MKRQFMNQINNSIVTPAITWTNNMFDFICPNFVGTEVEVQGTEHKYDFHALRRSINVT